MKKSLVSIVIPTHNRKLMLERLLKSVLSSTYTNLEIIVVDDASADGTYKFVKSKFKRVKVFKNKKNLFTAGSRNEGFKRSKGEFVFFIDDDNILDKYAIEKMVHEFLRDNTIGELGAVNYNPNDRKKILWAYTKRNMWTSKTTQPRTLKGLGNKKIWETVDVPNAFMIRSDVVKKNKIFFREKYGIMYEESDYAYRIRKAGYRVMTVREAKIYHDIENSSEGNKGKDYMFHFMEDNRRPFVIARNRILFHSLFSNRLQLFFILIFWIWLFMFYYLYKIIFYSGVGNFSLFKRIILSYMYLKGTFNGIYLLTRKSVI